MRREIYSNWPYIFWLIFYFTLFWLISGATVQSFYFVLGIYGVSILLAFSPLAEGLWRAVSGVRHLATNAEEGRLIPLFNAVYKQALKCDPHLQKNITLYIQEDMDINAFAFGRRTLVLTRGSVMLLSDEALKGLIAHEFGHFSHFDTRVILFAAIGNLFMSVFMRLIYWMTRVLLFIASSKDEIYTIFFKIVYYIIMGIYKIILFVGDIILMSVSREHEFMADAFAKRCGFGSELVGVLDDLHQIAMSEPRSVFEQLRSTHPPLYERIEHLENISLAHPMIRETENKRDTDQDVDSERKFAIYSKAILTGKR